MVELMLVRTVLRVEGGEVVSKEITKTPMHELTSEELLCALKVGPAHYKPVRRMGAQMDGATELAAEG